MAQVFIKRSRYQVSRITYQAIRGFTLFELLIVIAIIGVLVSLGTASYTSAQKKSRDGRRQSDLKAIQNGFEQYYADNNGLYPSSCNALAANTTYFPSGFPKDPKSGAYYYTAGTTNGITISNSCSTSSYYVMVTLEGTATGGNSDGTVTGGSCTNAAGAYFCVKSLQ